MADSSSLLGKLPGERFRQLPCGLVTSGPIVLTQSNMRALPSRFKEAIRNSGIETTRISG